MWAYRDVRLTEMMTCTSSHKAEHNVCAKGSTCQANFDWDGADDGECQEYGVSGGSRVWFARLEVR